MAWACSIRERMAAAALGGLLAAGAAGPGPTVAGEAPPAATVAPSAYAADFVATAATGVAMNEAGDVTGTSYPDPGCGSSCLPPQETVVWRGGERIVLPPVPGLTGITVRGINAQGWVAGFAGFPGTLTHAVVWKPSGDTYEAVDLGTLPGTTISEAAGIDDLGRVVGYARTQFFPPTGAPFVWSEATGMVDLSAQGFPDEAPLAISPGGTVATPGYWYRLDDPGSVTAMAPPPPGFYPPGTHGTAINDAGDQARFLVSTGAEFLPYLFRYGHAGTWRQIWFLPAGRLAPYGVGGINGAGDLTATVGGRGLVAYGPDGLAEPLAGRLSPAYGGGDVTSGGPITAPGRILSRVMIGRSPRLMKLVEAVPCGAACIRVRAVKMRGKFIPDPKAPGQCTPDAANRVVARVRVTDETGSPLRGVVVTGRFLDDYWLDRPVTGTTSARGVVKFVHTGPACVGAVAFLVDGAAAAGRSLDRTRGILTGYVIPLP